MANRKNVSLLTIDETLQLPTVIDRRNKFKKIIKTSIVNYDKLFSNCLMIAGKPGSGKTTLTVSYLEKLKEDGIIDSYVRASGHVTPRSLYNLLYETSEINRETGLPKILVLDDVDCMKDPGCLELMKSAFDTRSKLATNRQVYYLSEGRKSTFKYNGFGIIITNDNFLEKENSVHLDAIMDRVQPVSCDLKVEDMQIYTTHLIEDYLNTNEDDLDDKEIDSVVNFFNSDIRNWMDTNSFQKAKINYSLRLVKKFIDCQKSYGEDWKMFSLPYQKLEAAYDMISSQTADTVTEDDLNTPVIKKNANVSRVVIIKKRGGKEDRVELPMKDSNGRFLSKKSGKPVKDSTQNYYERVEKEGIPA